MHECVILLIFVNSAWGQVTIPPPHPHADRSGLRLPARPECLSTPLQGWKEWVPTSEPRRVEVEWSISNVSMQCKKNIVKFTVLGSTDASKAL